MTVNSRALTVTLSPCHPVIFRARFVRAGRIRAAGNRPGPIVVEPAAIREAVARGLFEGRAVFVNHAGVAGGPSLRHLAGVTAASAWNEAEQAAEGVIRLYEKTPAGRMVAQLLDHALADVAAGQPTPDIGLSLVFWPEWEDDRRPTTQPFRRSAVSSRRSFVGPVGGGHPPRRVSRFCL